MMRSVLVWIVHGLIPQSEEGWRRISNQHETTLESAGYAFPIGLSFSFLTASATVIAFVLWLGLVMYLSKLWRDHIDGYCARFTQWIEDVMLGKTLVNWDVWVFKRGDRHSWVFKAKDEEPKESRTVEHTV